MLRHFSIRKKLTLLTLFVCLTSLVLGTAALLIQEVQSFRASAVDELAAQARIFAGLSTAAIAFDDDQTAAEILAELKNRPHVLIATIFHEGKAFASYRRDGCTIEGPNAEPTVEGHAFLGDHVSLAAAIWMRGERLGTIYLMADTGDFVSRMRQNVLILLSVFAASALLALLLASKLQRLIAEPIQRLSNTAGEIARSQNYSLRAVKHGDDELGRLTDVFNQMLARIQAQDRQLKEGQERFELAVLGSSDGLWDLDLVRLTAYYSARCKTMLGYDGTDPLDDQAAWRLLTHPEDVARMDAVFLECWTGARSAFEAEFRVRARDGSYRWILARGAVLRDAQGAVLRMAGSHSDITARKHSEAALLESESRFRSLVHSASEGIIQADEAGRIISWNRGAEALFGYPAGEILDESMTRIIVEREQPVLAARIGRYLEEHATAQDRNAETIGLRRDGTEVPIDVSLFFWVVDRRKFLGAIIRDITEQKRAAQELDQVNQRLRETSRQAGMAEIATGVLHNVGNVLNSVNVSTTLVVDRLRQSKLGNLARLTGLLREHDRDLIHYLTVDPKGRLVIGYLINLVDHLQVESEENARELGSLADNIEHIKQIVAMQQSYARVTGVIEPIPAERLIDDALQVVSTSLTRSGITLARDVTESPPVLVDKHKVLQALVNVLTNARQSLDEAAPAEKRITISIRRAGPDKVDIAIRDNGLGIAPENLTRIFQHGFTTKRDGHGFGLHSGANALQEIGGSLVAASEGPGCGAVFTVSLPTRCETPAARAA
jgi:PAS domain S-box-containing protein